MRRIDHPDRAAQAEALARSVAETLERALQTRGAALLCAAGGSTPRAFLEALAAHPLDWARITVTPSDERWAPANDPRSNEAMLRAALSTGPARVARIHGLYTGDPTPEQGLAAAERAADALPDFDACVLGMGEDGHTASLFPGAEGLTQALAPDGAARLAAIRAPGAAEPRVTFTAAALLRAGALHLLIAGEAKAAALARALAGSDEAEAPVRALFRRDDLTVHWAP